MLRLFASASLAALLLAACAPEEAAPPGGENAPQTEEAVAVTESVDPGAEATAPADFQLSYKVEAENYIVTSEIDPAILAFDPALAWRLWTATKVSLDEVAAQAEEGRKAGDEYAEEAGEPSWFHAYTMDVTHKATLVLDDVISVGETTGVYTGGAHPNYFLGGSIWRKGASGPLPLTEIVADTEAFTDLVIAGLVEEKITRGWQASERATIESSVRENLTPSAEYPNIFAGRIILEPSTEAGKAGGVTVVFSPYDVGAYAEGAFEVEIPASALAPVLTESWKARFGGSIPATE